MPIFGSPGHMSPVSQVHGHGAPRQSTNKSQHRRSLSASLSSSVKSLFSRRTRQARDSWGPMDCTPEASPRSARYSAALDGHCASVQSLGLDEECGVRAPSDRYSQARERALADTVRRLQQGRPQSPLTPSSIGTAKTLPFFAEEDEYERQTGDNEPAGGAAGAARGGIPRFGGDHAGPSSPTDAAPAQSLLRASRETLNGSAGEKQAQGDAAPAQRYSVAMSQNLTRRFQPRAAHELDQRIYCLHAHYADVIERLEARARGDSEQLQARQRELDGLRSDNAALKARVAELKTQRRTSAWNLGRSSTAAAHRAAADSHLEEVRRLTRETVTAQEWVITFAELVVGPKQDAQSWDEWLNLCLDALQRRRKQQEQEWLAKIGWRATVPTEALH